MGRRGLGLRVSGLTVLSGGRLLDLSPLPSKTQIGVRIRVWGVGFRVSVFRVWGLGFRVLGLVSWFGS